MYFLSFADFATSLYPQKSALTSLTSGDSSIGIVRSRIEAKSLLVSYICQASFGNIRL
jgi:hypothetical protein